MREGVQHSLRRHPDVYASGMSDPENHPSSLVPRWLAAVVLIAILAAGALTTWLVWMD